MLGALYTVRTTSVQCEGIYTPPGASRPLPRLDTYSPHSVDWEPLSSASGNTLRSRYKSVHSFIRDKLTESAVGTTPESIIRAALEKARLVLPGNRSPTPSTTPARTFYDRVLPKSQKKGPAAVSTAEGSHEPPATGKRKRAAAPAAPIEADAAPAEAAGGVALDAALLG